MDLHRRSRMAEGMIDPRERLVLRPDHGQFDIVIYGVNRDTADLLALALLHPDCDILGVETLCTIREPSRGPALPPTGILRALKPGERIFDDDRNAKEAERGPEWERWETQQFAPSDTAG